MLESVAKTGLAARQAGAAVGTPVTVRAEFGLRTGFYTFALPKARASRFAPLAAAGAGLFACAILIIGVRSDSEPATEPTFVVARADPALPVPAVLPEVPLAGPAVVPTPIPAPIPLPAQGASPPARSVVGERAHREESARTAPLERGPHVAEVAVGFAGVWAPTDGACSPRANRGNYLPAVIDAQGAFAGETSCAFRHARADQGGWTVSATCANPKGRWSTQVRLVVSGNRLTWSSARGTQTYVRCGTMTRRA